jgi:hypothetical protein
MENITPTPPALPDVPGVKKEKYIISVVVFILAVLVAYLAWYVNGRPKTPVKEVTSFDECLQAGYSIGESYPRQCWTPDGGHFVEELKGEKAGTPASPEAEASLGGDIYTQSQNPVKDKIPESAAPTVNPIDGAYKNPFE